MMIGSESRLREIINQSRRRQPGRREPARRERRIARHRRAALGEADEHVPLVFDAHPHLGRIEDTLHGDHAGDEPPVVRSFVRLGTWVGGDRDGNPNVTADVVRLATGSASYTALAHYFAELTRLGVSLGARAETLMGLSGLGDLVLTATSPNSRNFHFGQDVGRGRSIASLRQPGQPLAEGVETAPALVTRARTENIELPIAETMASVLDGTLPLDQSIARLMSRPPPPEPAPPAKSANWRRSIAAGRAPSP